MATTENLETAVARLNEVATEAPFLSLYLPIHPGLNFPRSFDAEAMDLLKGLDGPGDAEAYRPAYVERALAYVREEFKPAGRTLALFVGPTAEDVMAVNLQLALPALARLQAGPFLAPLHAALEDHPAIAIVCVGERDARIIVTRLGERIACIKVDDDVPGRQRQGGWAAFRFERERAAHVETHLRRVADKVAELHEETPLARIVFGGTGEAVNACQAFLPRALQDVVAGTFPLQIFTYEAAIIGQALPLAAAAEERDEVALATQIKDVTLARGAASIGWDETLTLLGEGRVHALALPVSALGTVQADEALRRAWHSGTRVEFIGDRAEAVLADAGGVGALLRY